MIVPFALSEGYWEEFEITEEDVEYLYNHLLDLETPLNSKELVTALIQERIRQAQRIFEESHVNNEDVYMPKGTYEIDQSLVFPAFGYVRAQVVSKRSGNNPELGGFQVIEVSFENGDHREFAAEYTEHVLNDPPKIDLSDPSLNPEEVMKYNEESLVATLEDALDEQPGFVRIAGRWFPRALLMDINIGQLNLVEAVLDMAGGGPLPTSSLLEQLDVPKGLNAKLMDFSFDLALQEDPRFDEVGPSGETLWYLNRLEPAEVLEPPMYLRYAGIEYDRSLLTPAMLELERSLDDELSPVVGTPRFHDQTRVDMRLIFPHLRAGTLPLSARLRHLFPTAYEAPRIRFIFVDGHTGNKFPGWVVRKKRFIFGLGEWYKTHGLMPGSIVQVQKGENPGEVVVRTELRRPTRDWVRTVLVGSDGGIVFAMLKQPVSTMLDDRMALAIPDIDALDQTWTRPAKDQLSLERVVVNIMRELARLNPQKSCPRQRALCRSQRRPPLPAGTNPGAAGLAAVVQPRGRPSLPLLRFREQLGGTRDGSQTHESRQANPADPLPHRF